ncbi:PQQ-binding-like beta-propeller repeat protein [Arthrobacter sulfonylureivorans]|uniref:PQQ-binding-like beta-propeller repeat protein n=1 Tax=Arthrobacter sulfonylureivorans TaxID=2486855 RepID=A0ABY3WEP8_9MICC|nr:PQQ-binding-like beta-propeller repeat protein [Arthrobacter sulfonylureivorans]UNK46174.1 PQQ-binding-like beta-propeller repeat protein [Arthrobacter sulfonylureivorans]
MNMHGIVRGPDQRGLPGVVVSNGQDAVQTDASGNYTLPDRGRFVLLSRPEGYTARRWWSPAGSEPIDFDLIEQPQSLPFEFVHLSDTHLSVPGGLAESSERRAAALYPEGGLPDQFESFLAGLPRTAPDVQAVFLTGDLVDHGLADEYQALIEILDGSPLPVHTIAGNHDHMDGRHESVISANNYLTNSADPAAYEKYLGPRWYSFDIPGLHVVAMDWHTHELGIDNTIQEEWLRNDLALVPQETPWILLFHDQPGESLLANVPRPPLATFSGHWHTSRVVSVDGTLHVNTPPAFFAGLDYSPPSWRRVTWDGQNFTLNTVALHAPAEDALTPVLAKSTIASTPHTISSPDVLWRTFLAGSGHRQGVAIGGDRIFAGSQFEDTPGGAVQALDPATGRILWTSRTDSAVKTAPALVGDVVISAEVTGDVSAYSQETGDLLWVCPSPDPLRRFAWGAPAPAAGCVVVGDQADLRRIDAATGKVIWRRTDLAPHHNLVNHAAPLIAGDLVAVGYWPSPQYPIGLSLETGEDQWPSSADESAADFREIKRLLVMGTAALDASTGSILLPGYSSTISIDSTSGALNWVAEHEGNFSPSAPVATDRGIITTVGGHGLEMLDRSDGRKLWEARVDDSAPFPLQPYAKQAHPVLAPPTVLGDRIILPCLDGEVRVFSLEGELLHRVVVGVPVAAPLADAASVLIGVGVDGGVFALDKKGLL